MAHHPFEAAGVPLDIAGRGLIAFALGELQQLGGFLDSGGCALDLLDVAAQARALATELLGALLVGPYGGIFQLAGYLFEALLLLIVLKETPVRSRYAPRDL